MENGDRELQTGLGHVEAIFAAARREGRAVFMPYLVIGHPDAETSLALVEALVAVGTEMFELGVPFSDPLADGPVIQRATQHALEQGVTLAGCLAAVRELRRRGISAGFNLMGYVNPLLAYGLERFCADATAAGVDGVIVPDLPPEENGELAAACSRHGLALIRFLAPTSTAARVQAVTQQAEGFLYLVSLTGVTGAREALPVDLAAFVARVRAATTVPLAVGFGISTPAQAHAVAQIADGVIVGTAIVTLAAGPNPVAAVRDFGQAMVRAQHKVQSA
ncbi:MAG: tryptophan synthase subunit alpha [Anaerolineae bacterium]|nr:tryptophan synthase subunit alpha [Anaerolineae bacterium]